ncbi:glycosyltransferase family 52 protein [Wielerella bovis]|uniref:glycosyltransferase family 52 n=1 Tax=Wielerella bovis TaxID=2917790 RepID=UPI002018ED04|nr:glycosyltransferase family 52 [Wielerella bovis]ULJ62190.1 glycosyltransferase family 52 protein [Wielerella bovis]
MPNLFICLTPLQALIAQQLIRQTAPTPAHLLMVCYAEADNAKFRHYYQTTAQLCQRANYIVVPNGKWQRECSLFKLLKNLDKSYQTIYAASIDNPNVQYPISHLHFEKLETFDDGTGNLYPNSILYRNRPCGLKRKLINLLQGMRYQTEDLRRLSAQHHTLYPSQSNISPNTVPLQLWDTQPETLFSGCLKPQKILLGQPIFTRNEDNIALFSQLCDHIQANAYFPHPRENYRLDKVKYIDTILIFEDYLLQQIQMQPETEFHIYHLASTAAINVNHFPRTQIHALRPDSEFFRQPSLVYLYDLMAKMNIAIENFVLDKAA